MQQMETLDTLFICSRFFSGSRQVVNVNNQRGRPLAKLLAATDYFDRGSTFCWFLAAQTIIIHRTSGSGYPIPAG